MSHIRFVRTFGVMGHVGPVKVQIQHQGPALSPKPAPRPTPTQERPAAVFHPFGSPAYWVQRPR